VDEIRDSDKLMLVLAYLGILAVIPLLAVKDSEYVRWHAKQGLALTLTWFGWMIIGVVLSAISHFFGWAVSCLGHVAFVALVVLGIFKALQDSRWKIPVVSVIAEKF